MDQAKLSKQVFVVFGTRPEAIKFAPVIEALKRKGIKVSTILFRQHGAMLDEALKAFSVEPTHDLGIIFSDRALFDKGMNIFSRVTNLVKGGFGFLKFLRLLQKERPGLLMVQGDTSTAFLTAFLAFFFRIPVAHVEAGLRTYDRNNPFPEETNRELIARLADLHFAPTEAARGNLMREGIRSENIFVTGNTAIDAMLLTLAAHKGNAERRIDVERVLAEKHGIKFDDGKKIILLTAHRRESFGEPLREMLLAAKEIAGKYSDIRIIYPVHPNPNVERAAKEILGDVPGVTLTTPIAYEPFAALLGKTYIILTDSGGIQEEASVLGKPVLVMRDATERAEAIGTNSKLVGRKRENIVKEMSELLSDPGKYSSLAMIHYAFGEGDAAEKIAEQVGHFLERK